MPRIDIKVPYDEKDAAKGIGSKWDPTGKTWYIPDGVNPAPFAKWIKNQKSEPLFTKVTSKFSCVAEASRECWRCEKKSSVFGIVLIYPDYTLAYDRETNDLDLDNLKAIFDSHQPHYMVGIKNISGEAVNVINRIAPRLSSDYSKTTDTLYWMNHCQHCNAKFGDWFLFEEVDGLMPESPENAKGVTLHKFNASFEALCDSLSAVLFFDHMTVKQGDS